MTAATGAASASFRCRRTFLGYRGTTVDETAMVDALERAHKAETLLRDAVESMSEGFVIYDRDDRWCCAMKHIDGSMRTVPRACFPARASKRSCAAAWPTANTSTRSATRKNGWPIGCNGHRTPVGPIEQRLSDGRACLISEQRMCDGGVAGLRIDISRLKETEVALHRSQDI